MALGPVAHHVEQRVAMVDESVQVGQGASGGSPQGCLPCCGAAPEGGQHHGTAQGGLADGVHVATHEVKGARIFAAPSAP